MQKISGILPSSARVNTVDLRESGATRPGAPSFGRPMGESNLIKNSIVRSAHRALSSHNELVDKRSREQEHADRIQKMADSFFKTRAQINKENDLVNDILVERQVVNTPAPTVSIPVIESSIEEPAAPIQASAIQASSVESPVEDMDAPDIGRYIDVMA